jgi:hypothetical protein
MTRRRRNGVRPRRNYLAAAAYRRETAPWKRWDVSERTWRRWVALAEKEFFTYREQLDDWQIVPERYHFRATIPARGRPIGSIDLRPRKRARKKCPKSEAKNVRSLKPIYITNSESIVLSESVRALKIHLTQSQRSDSEFITIVGGIE